MGTDIATTDRSTGSLTLPWASLAETILSLPLDERELSDEQFALIARAASEPAPVLPTAGPRDIGKLIATMAATLKKPRVAADEGRLKIAVYIRMLAHVPHAALKHATERALATLEWMPTPAELLKLAEAYTAPERQAHAMARILADRRRQREFEELLSRLASGDVDQTEIGALPERIKRIAAERGHLRRMDDGLFIIRQRPDAGICQISPPEAR